MGSISPHVKGQFCGQKEQAKDMSRHRYTQSDSAGPARVKCGCWLRYTRCGAYWRNLVNTVEPPACCGDTALRQIISTTCSALLRDTLHNITAMTASAHQRQSYFQWFAFALALSGKLAESHQFLLKSQARDNISSKEFLTALCILFAQE